MNRCLHTVSVLFAALGLFLLVVSVVLVPNNRALGETGEQPAPPPPHVCAGDITCDPRPQWCYYHQMWLRCTKNGDNILGHVIRDLCSTSRPECKDCKCTEHRIGDMEDRYCKCE
jgi:hypothetical protein